VRIYNVGAACRNAENTDRYSVVNKSLVSGRTYGCSKNFATVPLNSAGSSVGIMCVAPGKIARCARNVVEDLLRVLQTDDVLIARHDECGGRDAAKLLRRDVRLLSEQIHLLLRARPITRVIARGDVAIDNRILRHDPVARPIVGRFGTHVCTHDGEFRHLVGVMDGEHQTDDAAIAPAEHVSPVNGE
jgi:hypothetical protein